VRRSIAFLTLLGVLTAAPVPAVSAQGLGPAQLQKAGWDCILPPPEFNPYVHCFPPGELAGVISGDAVLVMTLTFETSDLGATSAPILGTERMIRADRFHGQPCPTDPPSFAYSWLFPRFGWDYYICHTFDSPW
jgi:hypothetical protein